MIDENICVQTCLYGIKLINTTKLLIQRKTCIKGTHFSQYKPVLKGHISPNKTTKGTPFSQ
jgi:hypothetical protein